MASYEINTIVNEWRKVIMFGVLAAVIAGALSFLFPLKKSATMSLLLIQKQLSQTDPYTAIKASERIADNLGSIIYTTSFFDKVRSSNFNIDWSILSNVERTRRKQWRDMIETQVVRGSGILMITVFNTKGEQANEIARAIAFILTTDGASYIGGGDLQVKLVDDPLVSRFPVKPNIPANILTGFALGVLGGAVYVLVVKKKGLL